MGAGWVAGVTRARALLSRCVGVPGARELAAAGSLDAALLALAATPYRRGIPPDSGLAEAQRGVTATLLWHLRVLAGWQPPEGVRTVRLLAAGFEIANTGDLLRSWAGADVPRPYRLGALATAWPRLARSTGRAGLRAALTASAWGDPGDETPAAVAAGMRMAAADRTAAEVPAAAGWAVGRAALVTAREVYAAGRPLTAPSAERAARLLGVRAVEAGAFRDFVAALPPAALRVLEGTGAPEELWRAEARWWALLERDGTELLRGTRWTAAQLVGVVAVLSADAWRVRAALESAARGGRPREAFDALV